MRSDIPRRNPKPARNNQSREHRLAQNLLTRMTKFDPDKTEILV